MNKRTTRQAQTAALFCLTILPALRRRLRERQPWAAFMAAGAFWFLAQAAFGA